MQNKHTPDIEGIVEAMENMESHCWKQGWLLKETESVIRERRKKILSQALQSQADQYEMEKGDIFWQGYEAGTDYQTHKDNLDEEDLNTIKKKYGVDLSE